jgi:hypothetical protein
MVAKAITAEGIAKFQLEVDIQDKGDLPDENIFVVEIQDEDDPKEDSFARVVTVDDLEELTKDRPTAVAAGDSFYRVKSWTFLYENVDTAANAKDVLKSRIDELVKDWRTYLLKFETTSELTDHPRVDTDTFNSAVETYELMLGAESVASDTVDTAKDAYDEAVDDAATAAADLADAESAWDDCKTAKAWYEALYNAMKESGGFYQHANTLKAAAETFRIACTGDHPTEEATFVTAQQAFSGQQAEAMTALTTAAANLVLFNTMCSTRAADVTAATAAKTTADSTVAGKRTQYEDAQSAYEAAQSASEAALAAVRALKPDYDPATATPNTEPFET